MTSNNSNPQSTSSPRRARGIVAIGLAVALVGVYAMLGSNGNEQVDRKSAGTGAASQKSGSSVQLDKSLSTGALAAFVFKKDRPVLETGDFKDGDGNTINMSNWKGCVALVNLWATWCPPA